MYPYALEVAASEPQTCAAGRRADGGKEIGRDHPPLSGGVKSHLLDMWTATQTIGIFWLGKSLI